MTPEIWDLLEVAEIWRRGTPPVAGGTLDQVASFVDAARFAWADEAHWRSKQLTLD